MVIRKKKCRDCGNAITHNTVCCPYCGSVDPFGYYRNTDRIVTILLAREYLRQQASNGLSDNRCLEI